MSLSRLPLGPGAALAGTMPHQHAKAGAKTCSRVESFRCSMTCAKQTFQVPRAYEELSTRERKNRRRLAKTHAQQAVEGVFEVPPTPDAATQQVEATIREAYNAGQSRQIINALLPLVGATDLDDWCGLFLSDRLCLTCICARSAWRAMSLISSASLQRERISHPSFRCDRCPCISLHHRLDIVWHRLQARRHPPAVHRSAAACRASASHLAREC